MLEVRKSSKWLQSSVGRHGFTSLSEATLVTTFLYTTCRYHPGLLTGVPVILRMNSSASLGKPPVDTCITCDADISFPQKFPHILGEISPTSWVRVHFQTSHAFTHLMTKDLLQTSANHNSFLSSRNSDKFLSFLSVHWSVYPIPWRIVLTLSLFCYPSSCTDLPVVGSVLTVGTNPMYSPSTLQA